MHSLKQHPIRWLLTMLIAAVVLSQLERFTHKGTILGYQVRSSSAGVVSRNAVTTKDNLACKKVVAADVQKALDQAVSSVGSGLHDRTQPTFLSICSYRTTSQPTRTVSIVVRDVRDETAAIASFGAVSKRSGSQTVNKLGDQAVFVPSSNQIMVRKGKRLITITVTKSSNPNKPSSQTVATKLAAKAL